MNLDGIELGVFLVTLEDFLRALDVPNSGHKDVSQSRIRAKLCDRGVGDGRVLPGRIKFHDGFKVNLLEIILLLGVAERESEDPFPPIGSSSFRNGVAVN